MPDYTNLTSYQKQLIEEWVDTVDYTKMGDKTTIAFVKLVNGFEIVGTSACVAPEIYQQVLGETLALENALSKLGEHVAFTQHIPILKQLEIVAVEDIDTDDMMQFIQDKFRDNDIYVSKEIIDSVIDYQSEYLIEVKEEIDNV